MKSVSGEIFAQSIKFYRNYPWRQYSDPYRIMIAEFMLHRTRAPQVAPIYQEFIKNYPDVEALANADENDIKNITKHLGLHWRSSHFIKAARYVQEYFNGDFPGTREELRKIPGVGDYVAGAILTICFNRPEYVIDSNIARFINRFYGLNLKGEIRRKKQIIDKAKELFNIDEPGTFLFAILDFTFKICSVRSPDCSNCVLNSHCKYFT
ncbi:MAG: A/G-specific adenine glycosylase [Acidobacteriota bacterium]|nr:A/G-specific adenine glycosylase [Acidobacteriota bacterium]